MCDIKQIYPRRQCSNQDVAVVILWKGEQVELCEKCADKILNSELEWGENES